MEERIIKCTEEKIKNILNTDINTGNIEYLYKLSKIRHMAKEDENMMYRDYERKPGFDSYGYDYERRGRDMKDRGYNHINRMYDDYEKYEDNKQRYGHNEDTKRSLKYMLESMENFARMLREDAQSQEEIDMIRQSAQRIAQM